MFKLGPDEATLIFFFVGAYKSELYLTYTQSWTLKKISKGHLSIIILHLIRRLLSSTTTNKPYYIENKKILL